MKTYGTLFIKKHSDVNHKIILFVAALPAELSSIKKEVKKLSLIWISAKFFLTWVWNYKALYNLKHYLDTSKEKPGFIVNIWLCGKTYAAPKDILQVYRILWWANWRELLCPIYIDFLQKQSILSNEKVITSETDMLWEQYVDMESYAIDIIWTEEKIPYILLKKPFDTVSHESKKIDVSKFKDCLSDIDYTGLIITIQKFLKKNHDINETFRQKYLKETLKHYNFTFSEKEIWKKWYARNIANWRDYQEFLNKNLKLEKKEFLTQLKTHV